MTRARALGVIGIVCAIGIVVLGTCGVRGFLAADDLPAWAKPNDFDQVAYVRTCYLVGCDDTWLYVSSQRSTEEALNEITERLRSDGWEVFPYCQNGTSGCEVKAHKPNRCWAWVDFRYDHRTNEDWWAKHLSNGTNPRAALLIHASNCG